MDPKKQLTNLDPKLKETYDRVMGMNLSDTPPPPQPVQPVETPKPPEVPKPPPDAAGAVTTIHTEEVKQMAHPPSTTVLKHGSSSAVYLAIAAVLFIFFIIYTIFWFKFLNFPIPFISSFI